MEAPLIWKKLVIDEKKIVTSEEILALAEMIGRDGWRSVKYLQTQGYILRILKGIFYVRGIEERERGGFDPSIYMMVATALRKKGVKNWYFGMESGLKFNMMTHEYFNTEYVITGSYRTTKVIKILDSNFKFVRRGKGHFQQGILRDRGIYYSDPEKTVLDIAYRRYLIDKGSNYFLEPIGEYLGTIDAEKLMAYSEPFPKNFRERIGELL